MRAPFLRGVGTPKNPKTSHCDATLLPHLILNEGEAATTSRQADRDRIDRRKRGGEALNCFCHTLQQEEKMMRNRSNEKRGRWRSGDGGSRDISQFKKPEKHEDKGASERGGEIGEGGRGAVDRRRQKGRGTGDRESPVHTADTDGDVVRKEEEDMMKARRRPLSFQFPYDSRFHG